MGVELTVYRIRIGLFTMPKKCKHGLNKIVVSKSSMSVFLRLLVGLSVVLLMGGDVEINPGPPKRQLSQQTISFTDSPTTTSSNRNQSATARRSTAADNEVMRFLQEMKDEVRSDLASINGKLNDMNESITNLRAENEKLREENNSMKQEMGKLSKKLDYMEGQSRRNNLRFYGIPGKMGENWDDTETKVRSFIKETLHMPSHENVEIERAHRLNMRNTDTCPVVVKFNRYKDKESILNKARETLRRESGYTVREDYTERVLEHRRILGQEMSVARENGEPARLQYDKLIKGGQIYKYDDFTRQVVCVGRANQGRNQSTARSNQPNNRPTNQSDGQATGGE